MTGEVEVVAWRETLLSEIVSDPNLPPMAKVALEALRADNERLVKERDAAVQVAEMNATSGAFWAERGKQAEARAERAEASLAGRDAEIAKAVAEERERVVGHPAPSLPTREEVLAELVRGVCEACQAPAVGDGGGMLACGCHNTWRPRTVYERADAILALFAQPQEKKP